MNDFNKKKLDELYEKLKLASDNQIEFIFECIATAAKVAKEKGIK